MRLLPFTLVIGILSLSFCAQKEAPTPTPPVVTTPTTPTTPPTTTTDTTKKLVWSDEFGTDGAPSCASVDPYSQCGAVNIAGNDISWRLGNPTVASEAGMIVINITGASGNVQMSVPSGTFYF